MHLYDNCTDVKALLGFEYLHLTLYTSKHFWNSTAKTALQHPPKQLKSTGTWNFKKASEKTSSSSTQLIRCNSRLQKPCNHKVIWKYTLLVWSSWWTAKDGLQCFLLCSHSEGFIFKIKGVNDIFSNQYEISNYLVNWTFLHSLEITYFCHLVSSPGLWGGFVHRLSSLCHGALRFITGFKSHTHCFTVFPVSQMVISEHAQKFALS